MEALNRQYTRHEHFVFRRIQDEMLLVPIKDNVGDMGCIYNLNDVGAFIWEHMDGETKLGDILKMMVEEFDVSSERAEEDLREFIRQLEEIDAISYIARPKGGNDL
ncbi:MAG: PqqD family protein [bacterium]